jgi:hypothetical protein
MGFPPLQRLRSRGFGSRTPCGARARPCDLDAGVPHLPPSGLSVSHALAGFHPATPFRACFIPVTLLGFRLQGLVPPGEPHPFRGRLLSCRWTHARGRSATRTDLGSRALIPPESPFCEGPKSDRSRCPPGVVPSKASSSSGVSKDRCPTSVFQALASPHPPHPPAHFTSRACARHGCASECCPARVLGVSLLRGRRPSWGFSPLPDRILANPSGCR